MKYILVDEAEKLPNKIKVSLERGNIMHEEWNDENKLCSCINNCINIENNFKNACDINNSLKKCGNKNNSQIDFYPKEEKEIKKILY